MILFNALHFSEEEVGQHQTIEEALYVLGKNILGRDVNDKIFPVAKQFAASIGSIGQSLPKVEFERGKIKLMPSETVSQKIKSVETNSVSSTSEDQKDQRHIGVTKEDTKVPFHISFQIVKDQDFHNGLTFSSWTLRHQFVPRRTGKLDTAWGFKTVQSYWLTLND